MPLSDDIGLRGEAIFIVRLTQSCGPSDEPLIRPHFLGEKCATLDYLVELMGEQSSPGYFFVQVKTTTRGFTSAESAETASERHATGRQSDSRLSRSDLRGRN